MRWRAWLTWSAARCAPRTVHPANEEGPRSMKYIQRIFSRQTNSNTPRSRRRWVSRLQVQFLEDRTVPTVTDFFATGAGIGGGPHVKLFDTQSGALTSELMAYDPQFTGGVRVAIADVNGDGVSDLITGPGPGGGPHIRVFDGVDRHIIREFMAFNPDFRGGVNVAAGDLDGDHRAEIVVTPDAGGGPIVRVFSGASGTMMTQFNAYDPAFRGGANVALGDVSGDGTLDIITGAGVGGAPHVRVFDGSRLANPTVTSEFFAYDLAFRGGVFVAAVANPVQNAPDLVVTGAGVGGGPHVKVYDVANPANPTMTASFMAYPIGFTGGVHVSTTHNSDGAGEILIGPGLDNRASNAVGPRLIVTTPSGTVLRMDWVYAPTFTGGIYIGGVAGNQDAPNSAPNGTFTATPANEGGTSQARFTNVTGGSGGYLFSFDFDNDGNFEVANSSSANATMPAALLADGPSSRIIRGRIRDTSGSFSDFTTTVTVANVNPLVQFAGSFTGLPGAAINFSATVSDPSPVDTAAGFRYSWNFGDGTAISTAVAPSHVYSTPGSYTVTLQVTDKDNGTSTATANVNVGANPPPQATLTADNVNEGSNGTVGFTNVTGGSGGYRFSFDFDNNGVFEVTDSTSATATVPASYLSDGPGTRTVRGRVKDSAGAYTDYTATAAIANVPPTVQLPGTFAGAPGVGINFSATATDPSPVDTAAGFTYTWNFGDGTATSNAASPNHVFANAGYYTVTVTISDKDGGSASASAVTTVGSTAGSYIVTPFDRIPNFGANPTITATRSGSWSDSGMWSLGRLPAADDIVSIGTNLTVTYDVVSAVPINTVAIQAGGSLVFRTDVGTRLTVVNVLVMPGGTLQVGTAANPVAANVKAEIIIADQPFDLVLDPEQYGHGLIALGTVTMHGATRSDTFVRLASEPHAGDLILTLQAPVSGWRVGDRLFIPDSRQLRNDERNWDPNHMNYVPMWETATIGSISADGRTLTLTAPLQFTHPGARDGNNAIAFLPHVANLTRNVTIRSAANLGTRGHTFFTDRALVDIRYASFAGLGRTELGPIDNTTFDSSGSVSNIGTNESERYPVNFHHLAGPATIPANGFQFTFTGNAVTCSMNPQPFRWGIALNDSHYGLISDNVVYNWAGAGIMTVNGNESFNVVENNFVGRVVGTGSRADSMSANGSGTEGSGIWLSGPNNYVRDNVFTDVGRGQNEQHYGATLFFNIRDRWVPAFQGADPSIPSQWVIVDLGASPIREFSGNEIYGATARGLEYWYVNSREFTTLGSDESVISGLKIWGVHEMAVFGYYSNRLTFDDLVIRGDFDQVATTTAPVGVYLADYLSKDFVIRNSDIQGMSSGFVPSTYSGDGLQTIEDSYMRNLTGISVSDLWTSSGFSQFMPARVVNVRNVRFDAPAGQPLSAIAMWLPSATALQNRSTNLIQRNEVYVYDFNGHAGDNYQVYFHEQAPDYVLPQSTYDSSGFTRLTAAPEAGLTNQQAWDLYGIALAGSIAPMQDTMTLPGIDGLARRMS